jgi:acyl-CoA oxidase
MDFRVDGELVDGITVDDMGKKTTGNDLDNAWIAFDNVTLPHSAMLSR